MKVGRKPNITNPNQHCTSEDCLYTFSHTAAWCDYPQPRRCKCGWCYPRKEKR